MRAIITAAIVLASTAAASAETIIQCDIRSESGWIPATIAMVRADGSDAVVVNDPIITKFRGQPLRTTVKPMRDGFAVTWNVRTRTASGQRTNMRYRAEFSADARRVAISARPRGFTNRFYGRGACIAGTS